MLPQGRDLWGKPTSNFVFLALHWKQVFNIAKQHVHQPELDRYGNVLQADENRDSSRLESTGEEVLVLNQS